MDVQVDDRTDSELGDVGIDDAGGQEAGRRVMGNGGDHGVRALDVVVQDEPQLAGLALDRAHRSAERDARTRFFQHRRGRLAVQPLQWHSRDADVARIRGVEQPGAKDLHRLRERRLVRGDVQCRQRDQVPECLDRARRLAVRA